jgi:hypothetical protein
MASSNKLPQVQPQWYETIVFRIVASLLLSALCTSLLVIAGYYSEQKQVLGSAILFALIPAIIFGVIFAILQYYHDNAEKSRIEIDLMINSNTTIRSELIHLSSLITHTVENAGEALNLYEPIRRLLNTHYSQARMIQHFMRLYMSGPLRIWGISEREFYEMTIEGARQCNTYDAIHHGAISALEKSSFPPSYLSDLKEVRGERRRIVVLHPGTVAEVQDKTIRSQFLAATKGTTSYWIEEDDFLRLSQIHSGISLDCALHDKKMLLRLDRSLDVATLSFKGQHEEICDGIIRAFEALDLELERRNLRNAKFHLISDDVTN